MPTFKIDGGQCHYTEAGRGQTVVLAHAGASSGGQWRGVNKELEHEFHLVAIDFYGCGKTSLWPGDTPVRVENDAQLLRTLLEKLDRPVHLVAHSLGGSAAMLVAAQPGTALKSLTLIEPDSFPLLSKAGLDSYGLEPKRVAETFRKAYEDGRAEEGMPVFIDYHFSHEPGWEGFSPEVQQQVLDLADAVYAGLGAQLANNMPLADCARIAAPTLIVAGEHTRPAYRQVAELLAAQIPGALLADIPDAGHRSPVTHAPAVAAVLRKHLLQHG